MTCCLRSITLLSSVWFLVNAGVAFAQDASVAGEVTAPHPTLRHLTIEWAIAGDADLDGVAGVRF